MENQLIDTIFILGGALITAMGGIIIYFLKGVVDRVETIREVQQKQQLDIELIKERMK